VVSRHILVVDAEELVRWSLVERLRAEGYEVSEVGTAAAAMEEVETGVDLVLLDSKLPDGDGLAALQKMLEADPDVPVVHAAKPFALDDITQRVNQSLETARLRRELRTLRDTLARAYGLASIVGESEPMQRVKALVKKVATSPGWTVLITGETGVGKGLIARVIHQTSARAARPFLSIVCSALPEAELESALFGRERDAAADAPQQTRGLLEQADQGTIFLDDIGELAPALQARLVRFLEEKTFRRVGGSVDIHVDVRVVAATARNLEELAREGKFRDDLYYRLNVLRVEVPPLRARGHDIILLAQHFVGTFQKELKRSVSSLSPDAEAALRSYAWPGNVRELRNLVERAVLLADDATLRAADFEALHTARAAPASSHGGITLPEGGLQLEEVERALVVQALERAGGNQTRAAALLGLHRDQIRYRIEKFGLAKKP
jgi:two-component system response regulator AtoC